MIASGEYERIQGKLFFGFTVLIDIRLEGLKKTTKILLKESKSKPRLEVGTSI
jgi:hypothetical protein